MPDLYVIAGPNGAGKSTNNDNFLTFQSFDFDNTKIGFYNQDKFDHELREQFAHQKTIALFESEISASIANQSDYAYETNFHDSNALCRARVDIRAKMGGHDVSTPEIETRFNGGLKNVNAHFLFFDSFVLVDNTEGEMKPCLFVENGIKEVKNPPDWIRENFSSIIQRLD